MMDRQFGLYHVLRSVNKQELVCLVFLIFILSACSTSESLDKDDSKTGTIIDSNTYSGVHEDISIFDWFNGCKFNGWLNNDMPIDWFEDETFVIDSWVPMSSQFTDDFYLDDYDDTWLDEYINFYQKDDEAYFAEYGSYPWAHDLNEDGLYIDIHEILNSFNDDTILYDDTGDFYGEDCDNDSHDINGIRYKDSYLSEVLKGDITPLIERTSDPEISRFYKTITDPDDDSFVDYITIGLKGYKDGTDIYVSCYMSDTSRESLPTVQIAYTSDAIICQD